MFQTLVQIRQKLRAARWASAITPRAVPAIGRRLESARARLLRLLQDNVLPYWDGRIRDEPLGGFRLHHDVRGQYLGPADKTAVSQARVVWFFSRLCLSPWGTPAHAAMAAHGFEFLRRRLWDSRCGGFFWQVDPTGQIPTRADKHLYAQAFGLYALSTYARATREPAAAALAHELFACIERCHDAEFGGYREFFHRDWTDPPPGELGPLGAVPALKLTNTHLHLLEAFTEYVRLTADATARQRLIELITILSNAVVHKRYGACTDRHRRNWSPAGGASARVSYGHDLELIWLLMDAHEALGVSDHPLTGLYQALFDHARAFGFDRRAGGFWEAGRPGRPADRRGKVWWVQAEALVACLRLALRTGRRRYARCFLQTLDWVERHQADWEHGDWHAIVAPDGRPRGDKVGAWKEPYHHGRALLECLRLLPPGGGDLTSGPDPADDP